ncbi:MAG: acyltransferase [Polyangiaceae bacterium]
MSRNSYIDALRGLSIVLVVVLHVQIRVRLQDTFLFRHVSDILWAFWCRNGHNGVRIFFVISGFLITSTSLARWGSLQHIDARRFYQLRFARIAPPLLLLLALLSLLHLLGVTNYTIDPAKATLWRALFSALTLHLNWLEAQVGYLPAAWDVLWSLSVEEAFYLFFPFACLALRRAAGRVAVLTLLALLIIIAPIFRALEQNPIWNMKAYLACFDAIAIGCLAAAWLHQRTLPLRTRATFAIIGGALVLAVLALERRPLFVPLNAHGLTETILALGVAALLVAAARAQVPQRTARWLRPLTACGRLSYEIYLTHIFVVFAALSVFKGNDLPIDAAPVMVAIVLAVSWALAALVERYISAPSNRWLRGAVAPATEQPRAGTAEPGTRGAE